MNRHIYVSFYCCIVLMYVGLLTKAISKHNAHFNLISELWPLHFGQRTKFKITGKSHYHSQNRLHILVVSYIDLRICWHLHLGEAQRAAGANQGRRIVVIIKGNLSGNTWNLYEPMPQSCFFMCPYSNVTLLKNWVVAKCDKICLDMLPH